MTTPITTILATGPEGPTLVSTYDVDSKASWLTQIAYSQRDGGGSFLSFLQRDKFGDWYEVLINGGIVETLVRGKPNSDIDMDGFVDGVAVNVSFAGKWNKQPAMLGCWPALVSLGGPLNKYAELHLQEYPPEPGMPKTTRGYVLINGAKVQLPK